MKKSVKVAISLPDALLKRVDKERISSGASRSEVFRRALEFQYQQEHQAQEIQRYVQGYERMPETESEIEDAAAMSRVALSEEPWE
ncbi:MAG: CopG family transcriptional regulator [Actinomycetota bacterium]